METYQIVLFCYTVIVFISYILYVYFKFGILPSISDSYYKENNKALFTLFIWSIAIPLMIIGNSGLMFFAGSFLAFVGAAPAFREELEGKIHVIGAVGGIAFGFASMILDSHQYILPAIMVIFTLFFTLRKIKNHTWWIEIMAFSLNIIGLLIR